MDLRAVGTQQSKALRTQTNSGHVEDLSCLFARHILESMLKK